MIPLSSRVGGIGPTPAGEQPHHRAARQRTPEEDWGVFDAAVRRTDLVLVPTGRCTACGSELIDRWVDAGDPAAADDNDIHAECRACGQYIL